MPGAAQGAVVGHGVTASLSGVVIAGLGTTSAFNGYLKGIITGVKTDSSAEIAPLMLNWFLV